MIRTAILVLAAAASVWAQPEHVVVIGIDGFGAQAIRDNPVPAIRALMASGSWTLRARGVMPTVSSPNWASMIMGAGPEQHGVTSNEWQPDKFEFPPVCHGMGSTFPTIFGLLHQQRPASRISILHDWKDFARLVEPGAPTVVRHVLAIDGLVGKLVDAIEATAEGKRTAIIISGDHGGVGTKHGGNTMQELEIPWVASGAGIASTGEISSPVNTFDTAATIAALLGLKAPDCWLGRPVAEALR
jgi:hypothetical protein